MEPRHRQILETSQQYLCDNIIPECIVDTLVQDGIMSLHDIERINYEKTKSKKVMKILQIVKEHPKGYDIFLKSIKDNEMEFVYEQLQSTKIDENALKKGNFQMPICLYIVFNNFMVCLPVLNFEFPTKRNVDLTGKLVLILRAGNKELIRQQHTILLHFVCYNNLISDLTILIVKACALCHHV